MVLISRLDWLGIAILAGGLAAATIAILMWRRRFADTRIAASGILSTAKSPPIALYNLFELGVVDLNGDDRLDLYTANHDFGQSYLLAGGNGRYVNVVSQWELDQDTNFPGMEDQLSDHKTSAGHFSIFMQRRCLVLRDRGLAGPLPIRGTIWINGSIAIREARRADVTVKRSESDLLGIGLTAVEFGIRGGGCVRLFAPLLGTPISFSFDPDVTIERIHVGRGNRSPRSREFTVLRRDRHGHAWADINGDGLLDVYIGRGGFQGQIEAIRRSADAGGTVAIEDELLINDGAGFADRAAALGFAKKDCRTRGAAWVDIDNSGRLALYVGCLTAKNQLWVRDDDARFVDMAEAAGLDLAGCFSFVWVDVDRDGWIDLIVDERDAVSVYYNERNRRFRRVQVTRKSRGQEIKLSIADFNRSGYPSVVTASPSELLLLVNDHGTLKPQDTVAIGLPSNGLDAQWVDYDNDGIIELCVVPHGLYRQLPDGTFRRTDEFRFSRPAQSVEACVQWFDSANSGFRDAIIALRRPLPRKLRRLIDLWDWLRGFWVHPDARPNLAAGFNEGVGYEYYLPTIGGSWSASFLKNHGNGNNWIEIILDGAPGNPQAIGATVTVQTAAGRQLQGVGWAEGARYSQGHYRIYFGLGAASTIDRLEVHWPRGGLTELEGVAANQILHIKENG